ncbi:MAG: HAD family phosphatase [Myxococcota bacterium]
MILLLDVMGTLVHDPFHEEMPAFFGLTLAELIAEKDPTAWVEFEHGTLTNEAFLARFWADGRAFDDAGFVRCVRDAYRFLPGIEALLTELSAAGIAMHALSNYPSWYRWIEERLALSRFLSWSFVSCETGVRKPDPEAYRGPMRRLGVEAQELLFVDDREANVAAARAEGLLGHRFEDADGLRAALVAYGVL